MNFIDIFSNHSFKVKAEVGNVDILINNAGIVTGKKLLDSPDDAIARTIAVSFS